MWSRISSLKDDSRSVGSVLPTQRRLDGGDSVSSSPDRFDMLQSPLRTDPAANFGFQKCN